MHASESSRINPYAPSAIEVSEGATGRSFPESGIPFEGLIDLSAVQQTRRGPLLVGLILGASFIGLLLSSSLFVGSVRSSIVLFSAAASTALVLYGFVYWQTDRPLLKCDWMQGMTRGTLRQHRLDIRWSDGESAGSFLFPHLSTDLDFSNRFGRLFVIRSIPCFIPKQAVADELWQDVDAFRPVPRLKDELVDLLDPPMSPPNDSALVWKPAQASFFWDRRKHDFVCKDRVVSRLWFIVSVVLLMMLIAYRKDSPITYGTAFYVLWMSAAYSGLFWLAGEWRRRDWWSPPMPSIRPPKPTEPAPDYIRWLDSDRLLVGHCDAWICVPWSAVQKATISSQGIQFSFTPLGLDSWFLERSTLSDQQWQRVIDHVRLHTANVVVSGAARRLIKQRTSSDA